jgi:hypothetical protein
MLSYTDVCGGGSGSCVTGNQRQQRVLVVAAAAGTEPSSKKQIPNKAHPQPSGSRNARLYELFEDDGWGVEAMPAAPAAQQPATPAPPQRKVQQQQQQQKRTAGDTQYSALWSCFVMLCAAAIDLTTMPWL